MVEQPVSLRIQRIVDEAEGAKTFVFEGRIHALPGQFIMAWIPRVDQKPFGVSFEGEDSFGMMVQKVGSFTEHLFSMKAGDYIGIQGPYGKPFSQEGNTVALVAGGFGAAPLAYQADMLMRAGISVRMILGAREKKNLVYQERFKDLIVCTDDGSCGRKGYATDALRDLLEKEPIDFIYTCGPEPMMQKVIALSDEFGIPCEASLERYMKCGFGVCGQCCVDPEGICICKEGPVFSKEKIKGISEFGSYKRDGTGKKVFFRESV